MRFILFLAAFGVVAGGATLAANNPAASVFKIAAGDIGYKFFGVVIWCAAITSVVGASYTSVSFWKTLVPAVSKNEKLIISGFIVLSTIIFIIEGNPVNLLIKAGAINGIILPVGLAVILLAGTKSSLMKGYKHPVWLQVFGWLVVAVMSWMSFETIRQMLAK